MKCNWILSCTDYFIERINGLSTFGTSIDDINHGYWLYQPTPYLILQKIFCKYKFKQTDSFIDIGCGAGRVLCVAAMCGCKHVAGIEIDCDLVIKCLGNLKKCAKKKDFSYHIYNDTYQRFKLFDQYNNYFLFNPFSIKHFVRFVRLLLVKTEQIRLFLYCPPDEYINYLKHTGLFRLVDVLFFDKSNPFHATYIYEKKAETRLTTYEAASMAEE